MPNVTPLTVLLVIQAVLLAVSKLDFVTPTVNNVITVVLIVVNALLAVLFNTSPQLFARMTRK